MLTQKEAAKQRQALNRDIAESHRQKAAAALRSLREQLHVARVQRNEALAKAKAHCRAERLSLREKAQVRRQSALAELRDTYAKERAEARDACLVRKADVHANARDPIERAKGNWEAERKYQADLRRIEQGNRERRRAVHRAHAHERRSESDDVVRGNISPDHQALFERVKHTIKGSSRESRTEAFLLLWPPPICGRVQPGRVTGLSSAPTRHIMPGALCDDVRPATSGGMEVVMLEKYFLRLETLDRIRTSWIGSAVERYVEWLDENRYAQRVVFARVPTVMHFGAFAKKHGAKTWDELPAHVDPFVEDGMHFIKGKRNTEASRLRLRSDLRIPVEQMLRLVVVDYKKLGRARRTARPFTSELPRFFDYLASERGVCRETIYSYDCYITAFEKFLVGEGVSLAAITPCELTAFVTERAAGGVHKAGLAAVCNCLRVFLRYAHRQGALARDLSVVVDSPLVYRLSTVPRSIPWDEVKRLIGAVDRRDVTGKRDYAILVLLVTYGLRVKEVASLLLDDVDWKHDRIRIRDRKIGNSTGYPLTPAVGAALIEYIRDARPTTQDRHVFMRRVAPLRPIGTGAISSRMRTLLADAGITVPRPGGQVFRHTCVQRLVDAEMPYKTISDYVGHRSTLSQGTYAKVSVEALRDVALGDGEAVL